MNIGLWSPYLVHDIFQGVREVNGEADKEKVGLRVRQRSKTVVFLLSSSIPQCELDRLARRFVCSLGNVVLKHGRDIFL